MLEMILYSSVERACTNRPHAGSEGRTNPIKTHLEAIWAKLLRVLPLILQAASFYPADVGLCFSTSGSFDHVPVHVSDLCKSKGLFLAADRH